MKIPLCIPHIGDAELKALVDTARSGWLTDGPKNAEFEESFAGYIGVKRAVTLNSCTSALQLACEALSIKGEVILPSFTFVASANAVVKAGATPVFADIKYDTCNIDPDDIVRKITPETEAVMPVHYAGQGCDMDGIMEIARSHKLKVIEDSAEAIGGTFGGRKTGSFGTGCFSFFPTKNMTTAEGGMVTTDDDGLADRIKALAGHGMFKGTFRRERARVPWHREASMPGYNYRMSNILAAVGVEQLKRLDDMNTRRREHALYLSANLPLDRLDLPVEAKGRGHVYQMYTVKLRNGDRDRFVTALRAKGISASVHFTPPVHLQEYYKKNYACRKGGLPVTERVASSIVTLPMYPQLERDQLDYMVNTIKEALA